MNKLFNSSPRILVSNTAWHGHFKTSYPIAELIKLMEPEFRKILDESLNWTVGCLCHLPSARWRMNWFMLNSITRVGLRISH